MSTYKKPSVKKAMAKAIKIAGGKVKMAAYLGISYQSINGWSTSGKMPCTEFNGETFYSLKIQELTEGEVTVVDLLGFVPHPQQWAMDAKGE